ncbi:MAG: cell division control protein Cdc6, partial [Promethearchaeota archaeon]
MTTDYFENLLKKPSIFVDETTLDSNFIPEELPHREKELSLLSQLFLALITNPNSASRKVLITGKTGVGKTATVKRFGKMLMAASIKRGVQINYTHINCRKERTSYKVLIKIIHSIDKSFPNRGYSPQDLLEVITEYLNVHDLHLLIVLDELSYLIQKGGDLIYSLTRVNDDVMNAHQRISIIGI